MKRRRSPSHASPAAVSKKHCVRHMGDKHATDWLPMELWHVIAHTDEHAYRALLALPEFARSLTPSSRMDYRIYFDHCCSIMRGNIEWTRHDEIHRLDGPAVELAHGSKRWYREGKLHRNDGPAIEDANGHKGWYRHGKRHRDDGPAIEFPGGLKEWYRNGELHRDDGPAIEDAHGDEWWYRNGKLHRGDGPAIEFANGHTWWYRDGQRYWPE